MVFLTQNRVGKRRAAACAIVDVLAAFAEFEAAQGSIASLSQTLEFRVVLPDFSELISVDTTQLDMAELSAGNHGSVSTNGQLIHKSAAAGKIAASKDSLSSFSTGCFHCLLYTSDAADE